MQFQDKAFYIQLLIILIVVGGSILRVLYQVFFRSIRRSPGAPPVPGQPRAPGQELRDLLAELRRATAGGKGEKPAPDEPESALMGPEPPRESREQAKPEPPWSSPPPAETPRPIRELVPSEEVRALKPAFTAQKTDAMRHESVHEHVVRMERDEATRQGRMPGATDASSEEPRRRTQPPGAQIPLLGMSLRHAIIAQFILGPPRVRDPYRRGGGAANRGSAPLPRDPRPA